MKRLLWALLFAAVSILIVWILKQAFPKNTGALSLFLILLILDAFLWLFTRKWIRRMERPWQLTLTLLYWLPFGIVVAGVSCGFFSSYYLWPLFVKTYLVSVVFTSYITRLIPLLFLLLALLITGIWWIVSPGGRGSRPGPGIIRRLLLAGWSVGLAGFMVMMAGMVLWEHRFTLHREEITLEDLPREFDGIRIVQLSDLHLGSWNRVAKLEELVNQVNALSPDLIFFTGDLCNYSTADALPFRDILASLRATYGTFAVLGNHDYGDYMNWSSAEAKQENLQQLCRFYQEIGWNLLRNAHQILEIEGDSLVIAGVENWGSEKRFQRLADLPKALEGTGTAPVTLLLSHDPTYWDSIVCKRFPEVDITFSGHTHGGQVGIETPGWQWSPVQYLYPLWAGLYTKAPAGGPVQRLYVNRGAGTIGYAGRVGVWAEITLLVLKCKSD